MAKAKPTTRKAPDPLASVRVEPPKSAKNASDDSAEPAAESPDPAPQVTDAQAAAAKVALKAEKRAVVLPPKTPATTSTKYLVTRSQQVSWRGQSLRLKGGVSEISDEKFGPGAVAKFKAMGVALQEM